MSTESLFNVSALPYNSCASLYRAIDYEVDPRSYGTDCIGKLNLLMQDAGNIDWQLLTAKSHDTHHYAALGDGQYYDPFLFMTEPLSLKSEGVAVPTLLKDLFVRVAGFASNRLSIESFRRSGQRVIYSYNYDLENEVVLPHPRTGVSLSLPFEMRIPNLINGSSSKIAYKPSEGLSFKTNDPSTTCEEETKDCIKAVLFRQCGIGVEELEDYFSYASSAQAYLMDLSRRSKF